MAAPYQYADQPAITGANERTRLVAKYTIVSGMADPGSLLYFNRNTSSNFGIGCLAFLGICLIGDVSNETVVPAKTSNDSAWKS